MIQSELLMTTANTVSTMEDIIRILREQPEIREAVRREILTEELLDLPRQFAEMAAILRDVLATLERHTEAIAELRGDVSVLKTDVAELKTDMSEVKADVTELKTDMSEVKVGIAELRTSVAELRGFNTERAAKERYRLIAFEMGLEARRLLDLVDLSQLAMHEAASEFSPDALESFRNCDLVISAESPTEGECYIAVQVSRTVDHTDINRAVTHSEMLTRFTGRPAYPVVAGMERSGVTEQRLASGVVYWHRIPRSATQPG